MTNQQSETPPRKRKINEGGLDVHNCLSELHKILGATLNFEERFISFKDHLESFFNKNRNRKYVDLIGGHYAPSNNKKIPYFAIVLGFIQDEGKFNRIQILDWIIHDKLLNEDDKQRFIIHLAEYSDYYFFGRWLSIGNEFWSTKDEKNCISDANLKGLLEFIKKIGFNILPDKKYNDFLDKILKDNDFSDKQKRSFINLMLKESIEKNKNNLSRTIQVLENKNVQQVINTAVFNSILEHLLIQKLDLLQHLKEIPDNIFFKYWSGKSAEIVIKSFANSKQELSKALEEFADEGKRSFLLSRIANAVTKEHTVFLEKFNINFETLFRLDIDKNKRIEFVAKLLEKDLSDNSSSTFNNKLDHMLKNNDLKKLLQDLFEFCQTLDKQIKKLWERSQKESQKKHPQKNKLGKIKVRTYALTAA